MKAFTTAVAALAFAASSALAAEPPNDNFANAELLGSSLPLEATGTNVDATPESGENISPFAAGKSIWFEWEAAGTGWTTIGACESNFRAVIGIFTGTSLGSLTKVASGNGAEGPQLCGGEREYTFKAEAGTRYLIGVDGNAFSIPEEPPPITEGEVALRIEATPPPVNDAFSAATPIAGQVEEEPDGTRRYLGQVGGYNWGATTEGSEPSYGAGAGASVWYSWTPPETADYHIGGPCCGSGLSFALFAGDSLAELTPVPLGESGEVEATGGTRYWIAAFGTQDAETSEPSMGSFTMLVDAGLAPASQPPSQPPSTPAQASTPDQASPANPPQPPPRPTPPDTKIDRSILRIAARTATFWFSASEAAQGFLCQLDKGSYEPCGSPWTYKHLKTGRHAFRVKALDLVGNLDDSPAVVRFTVPRPYRGRH